MARKMAKLR